MLDTATNINTVNIHTEGQTTDIGVQTDGSNATAVFMIKKVDIGITLMVEAI